jgi:hypothetical protein
MARCWVDTALYQTPEYTDGQKKPKWIERFFSWLKTTAQRRKTRLLQHPLQPRAVRLSRPHREGNTTNPRPVY